MRTFDIANDGTHRDAVLALGLLFAGDEFTRLLLVFGRDRDRLGNNVMLVSESIQEVFLGLLQALLEGCNICGGGALSRDFKA